VERLAERQRGRGGRVQPGRDFVISASNVARREGEHEMEPWFPFITRVGEHEREPWFPFITREGEHEREPVGSLSYIAPRLHRTPALKDESEND
jgi:hypothetical protein